VKNIFVGNLDFAVTVHLSLRRLPPNGNIESVDLIIDYDAGPVARFCVRRNRRSRPGGPGYPQSERPQARARLLNVVKRVPTEGGSRGGFGGVRFHGGGGVSPADRFKELEAGARRRRFFFGDEDANSVGR